MLKDVDKHKKLFSGGNPKKLFKSRASKIIGIAVLIVVIIAGIFVVRAVRSKAASSTSKQRTATVRKGEISTSITGSGTITSSNRIEITSQIETTVKAVHFKEGDRVKAGDLIVELDDTNVQSAIEKSQNSIEETQLSNQSGIDDLNSLTLTAPFDGQVKNISAQKGSTKGKNESIMELSDTSKFNATFTFTSTGINEITTGKQVSVYSPDFMESLSGVVTYVSSRPYSTSSGGELYNVEVEVSNPGSLQEGMTVTAEVSTSKGTISSTSSGTLSCINKAVIKSSAGGTVTNVYVKENDYVKKGALLAKLENKDTVVNKEITDLKMKDMEKSLSDAQKQLGYCNITSPIDGVIVKMSVSVGNAIKQGASIVTIADDKNMEFSIPVDELDIAKIQVGQEAQITVDALTETTQKPLAGVVTNVAAEGTSSNGVATYPVTIKINNPDKLKGGMNANAEIYITKKTGILYVPLQAIQKIGGKSYVMLKGDAKQIAELKKEGKYLDIFSSSSQSRSSGSSNNNWSSGSTNRQNGGTGTQNGNTNRQYGNTGSQNNTNRQSSTRVSSSLANNKEYYSNAIPTLVEVGINNESYIEIVSGLKEGDEVILPPLSTGSASSSNSSVRSTTMNMGGGMMGGGAPPRD